MQNASRESAEMVTIHRSRNRVGSIERLASDAPEGVYVAGLMTLHRTLASMMQRFQVALINYAESDFDQGNTLAKLAKLSAAVAAYQEALKRNPDFDAAKANLTLLQKTCSADQKDDDLAAQEPNEKPDEIKFDEKGKKGKPVEVDAAQQAADMGMRNIQTTPAQLLQRKFAIEAPEPDR